MPKVPQSPGSVITSLMQEYQISTYQLAKNLHLSVTGVRQLAIGKTRINLPAALRLAKCFNTVPQYWLDLQTAFDLYAASQDAELQALLAEIPKLPKPKPSKAGAGGSKKPSSKKAAAAPPKAKPAKRKPRAT